MQLLVINTVTFSEVNPSPLAKRQPGDRNAAYTPVAGSLCSGASAASCPSLFEATASTTARRLSGFSGLKRTTVRPLASVDLEIMNKTTATANA